MPTITLEDVPEKLHLALMARAEASQRSLAAETLACLEFGFRMSEPPELPTARERRHDPIRISNDALWEKRHSPENDVG